MSIKNDKKRISKLLGMIAMKNDFIQGYCIHAYLQKPEIVILIKETMNISELVGNLNEIFKRKYDFCYLHIKNKNDKLITVHCKTPVIWFEI